MYSSKKFVSYVFLAAIVGVSLAFGSSWVYDKIYGPPTRYMQTSFCQIVTSEESSGKPTSTAWARVNHTLVLLGDNRAQSTLTVTAISKPPYSSVRIELYSPPEYGSAPQVLTGNTLWIGEMRQGETVTLINTLSFGKDGQYAFFSRAVSFSGLTQEGVGTSYVITVSNGRISKVTDRIGNVPPSSAAAKTVTATTTTGK